MRSRCLSVNVALGAVALACFADPGLPAGFEPLPDVVLEAGVSGKPAESETSTVPLAFPEPVDIVITATTNCWMNIDAAALNLSLPADAPEDLRLIAYWVDADHHWYQKPLTLTPASGNEDSHRLRIALNASASGWEARDHHATWHHRVRMTPQRMGLRLFSDHAYEGTATLESLQAYRLPLDSQTDPVFDTIRVLTPDPQVYERYELAITLPDRYDNPFDPAEIRLVALVETPDGIQEEIEGFYYQAYYRRRAEPHDRLIPQGAPHWRVRYTPRSPGDHQVTLTAQDRFGAATLALPSFTAAPPQHPGFVRVSENDSRFFEFSNGSPFFPIGHNLRSPFDVRMNIQFPWAIRHPEGAAIYDRYFRAMREHGETMTEIWMAPWTFGLEWSRTAPGYHGIGQYNLLHAWELDHVLESASEHGIYINLTIHNHGKFSLHWDPEWGQNPHNQAVGGYLESPEDYFTDERAMADFERLMRYIIARWGHSPQILTWKLWNELDLTGSQRERVNHLRPEVVEWHRRMADRVKAMDPYDHLIGTHFCGDFTHQNPKIIELPEIDVALVDAYHGSGDPLHIVDLMRRTAEFNRRFDKPVLITEFGGSPYGATLQHLDATLHAALWSSAAIPLGGAPMLWWWGLIEEQNYYPKFRALAAFMDGEDRRNPEATLRQPSPASRETPDEAAAGFQVFHYSDGREGLGWLLDTRDFVHPDARAVSNLVLRLDSMTVGHYDIEFWDTRLGIPIACTQTATSESELRVPVPAFRRDLAFKIRYLRSGQERP